MASTPLAVAGTGLIVAAGITSGQFDQLGAAIVATDIRSVVRSGIEILGEVAIVAILAMMGDGRSSGLAIGLMAGLWLLWAMFSLPAWHKKGATHA